jgi:membrane-bound inhibitor of C-type lysozyme
MRRFICAAALCAAASAGLISAPALAQQSPEDLNTALDLAKAGLNKAIDQARAYSALPIRDPHDVRYACEGGKSLTVKYMTVGDTALASIVLDGKTLVFANVIAASGARYASGQYIWWTKGPTGFLSDEIDQRHPHLIYRDCTETR